jgi:hypothetical protein
MVFSDAGLGVPLSGIDDHLLALGRIRRKQEPVKPVWSANMQRN